MKILAGWLYLARALLGDTKTEGKRVRFHQQSSPPVLQFPVERVRVCFKIVAARLEKNIFETVVIWNFLVELDSTCNLDICFWTSQCHPGAKTSKK